MSLAVVHTRARVGLDAPEVTVETHLSNGLPSLAIVGLPEAAVRESKDRVRSAILNAGYEFPARRITINLAPADLPKDGGRYDLAIALGILAASGQLPAQALKTTEFYGELALSGDLRPVCGLLSASLAATRAGRQLVVPAFNAGEAALPAGAAAVAAGDLRAVCEHLAGRTRIAQTQAIAVEDCLPSRYPDLADVCGQFQARRALEIAAAGGHSMLMVGPPGTGKTMLASRLPGILPPLQDDEALEVAAIRSLVSAGLDVVQWGQRPFRTPHHSASPAALAGGGSQPRPGEVTLAHQGVLFLDELPEFDRKVLEVMREPMESGEVVISRAQRQVTYPARFQLVAAMNPCPCGYLGDGSGRCRCTAEAIQRYRQRLSGPLLDRIDLHVMVPSLPPGLLTRHQAVAESSAVVRERVMACRGRQYQRAGKANQALSPKEIVRDCALQPAHVALLEEAMGRLGLSARAYHRVLKVARTIADLTGAETIDTPHLTEALGYRLLDRT